MAKDTTDDNQKEIILILLLFSLSSFMAYYMYRNRKKHNGNAAKVHDEKAVVLDMESMRKTPLTFSNDYLEGPVYLPSTPTSPHSLPQPQPTPIDESQHPGQLSPFSALESQADKSAALQIIPLETPAELDTTAESVFYKFSGDACDDEHRAEIKASKLAGTSLYDEKEGCKDAELDEILHILDAFILNPTLTWMFVEWQLEANDSYKFKFIMQQHLLCDDGKAEFIFKPICNSKSIDKHMINLWIRSETARKSVLDLSIMQVFSFKAEPGSASEVQRLIVPVPLLRTASLRPTANLMEMCQLALQSQNHTFVRSNEAEHAMNAFSQVISYCIDGLDGNIYMFYDIVEPLSSSPSADITGQSKFERKGCYLFVVQDERKRWNWKHIVDSESSTMYPDPICIEEHFLTVNQYSYSVIICPAWEVFISTNSAANSTHYDVLLSLQEKIKMLAISQVSAHRFLLQFLTENPMGTEASTITSPSALKYAFISIIAERDEKGDVVFNGVDPEEDVDELIQEIGNAKLFFENDTKELPSLCYKIKF